MEFESSVGDLSSVISVEKRRAATLKNEVCVCVCVDGCLSLCCLWAHCVCVEGICGMYVLIHVGWCERMYYHICVSVAINLLLIINSAFINFSFVIFSCRKFVPRILLCLWTGISFLTSCHAVRLS